MNLLRIAGEVPEVSRTAPRRAWIGLDPAC